MAKKSIVAAFDKIMSKMKPGEGVPNKMVKKPMSFGKKSARMEGKKGC